MVDRFRSQRFGNDEADPMAAMATLVDVMLVFACGLMAALVLGQGLTPQQAGGQDVERTRVLPDVPQGVGHAAGGYQDVGRVFRDPRTGKLILVERPTRGQP